MPDKFQKATLILEFRGGKRTKIESDLIEITEAAEMINIDLQGQIGLRPRKGTAVDGIFSTIGNPIKSAENFETANGQERPVRSSGTILEYRNPYLDTPDWHTLDTGFTSGQIFGFGVGDNNLYMGNAIEVIRRWSGAVAVVDSANTTDTVLAFKSQTDGTSAEALNFPTSGTVIFSDGTTKAYTGRSGLTLTGLSGLDALSLSDGDPVALKPETSGFTSAPLGNIFLLKDSQLFIAGDPGNPNALFGSKIGDVRDFGFSSPAVADDGFVIKFWGKKISGLANKGEYVAVLKENEGKQLRFVKQRSSTDTILTLPKIDHGFSGSKLGAVNQKSVINLDNDVIFSCLQSGLRRLTRFAGNEIDEPESLMDAIEPDFVNFDQTEPASGVFEQRLFLALRSASTLTGNDLVIIKDMRDDWISTFKGINASAFYIFEGKLYYHDAFTKNTYRMNTDEYSDFDGTNFFDYLTNWKSKFFDYGFPEHFKELRRIFIEGFITPNTTINVKFNMDGKLGISQVIKTIVGTANYVQKLPSIALGRNPFGIKGFANAQGNPTGLRKFRRVINAQDLSKEQWFKLQIEIETNASGQNYIINRIRPFIAVKKFDKTKHDLVIGR